MTIYDNTSAFGLMSEEDQAAMKEHFRDGGEIAFYYYEGKWRPVQYPSWTEATIYRAVKPEPKPITVLAPEHMPDWDEVWLAADEDGEVFCFDAKPDCGETMWINRGPSMAQIHPIFRLVDRGTVDWRESLICFRKKGFK